MYDLVAYRIKYTPHPHAGKGWCIYPSYDFTHGICDSLEQIDYSICTLEFEARRECYYWILMSLDLYRPKVYEMSRLNLEYTVLSKRRLLKLVDTKAVRGWTDPRMPTVGGLRRRGYTKEIINSFCNDIGATRASNIIEINKLYQTARLKLQDTTRRAMAALTPIKVTISNFEEELKKGGDGCMVFEVANSPTDASMGSHTVEMKKVFYIDASDFRMVDDKSYYGLAPNKAVGLKYHGGNLFCDEVVTTNDDAIVELKCHLDTTPDRKKPKSHITWVPEGGIRCEVRVYNNLFTVPEPTELWESELNGESEIVYPNAIIDSSVCEFVDRKYVDKWHSNRALQLERIGYFVVDEDTTFESEKCKTGNGDAGVLVFNRTVSLKEETAKKQITAEEAEKNAARKLKTKADKEAKEIRMTIAPEDLFRSAPEYKGIYSKFGDDGMPTHFTKDDEKLTKSALKKLAKIKQKHVKALAVHKKEQK